MAALGSLSWRVRSRVIGLFGDFAVTYLSEIDGGWKSDFVDLTLSGPSGRHEIGRTGIKGDWDRFGDGLLSVISILPGRKAGASRGRVRF